MFEKFNKEIIIEETLDLLTATINLAYKLKIKEEDINKHIEKLDGYIRSGKYKINDD